MVSFENTEIAFSHKSDRDLKRAHLLFKFISYPILLKVGKLFLLIFQKLHLPIEGLIKRTVFRQFCGGEHVEDNDNTIAMLAKYNVKSILDYGVEGKDSEEEAEQIVEKIIETILKAKNNDNIPFSVFKPSAIARFDLLAKINAGQKLTESEDKEFDRIQARFDRICLAAFEKDVPVLIDAEESWIQDVIDDLVQQMMAKYNKEKPIVFNTVQMYRHDRLAFLRQSFADAELNGYFIGMKIVRGAYMEKERERAEEKGYESPIHKTKADTDRDYNKALDFCIENYPKIAVFAGTHNEISSLHLLGLMDNNSIPTDDPLIYFSQLYGMSDNISFNLAKAGYNVAKYIPFGPVKEVIPYLIRRAEENTSVAGQTGRELRLILQEKKRRKGQ